jgi:hypothetical protein
MPTIIQIAAKVDALEKMVSNMNISSQDETKHPRNMTEKGAAHKARILFYQENKDNVTTKEKAKEFYGEELAPTFKNYPKLKKCTDNMYAALPTEEKDKYVIKAKTSVKGK